MFQIPHSIFFDYFFSFFSLNGYSIFIWIIIIVCLLLFEEKRDKKHTFLIYFLLSFCITAFIVSVPLKNLFHTHRPIPTRALSINSCPTNFSFPSGHAATAFAAATVLSVFDKKRRSFYYLVAVLISFSRIYLECHFLIDVVGGGVIGVVISRVILLLRGKNVFGIKLPD